VFLEVLPKNEVKVGIQLFVVRVYDLHVHATNLEKVTSLAVQLGYAGIGFVTFYEGEQKLRLLQKKVTTIGKEKGLEILVGIEARNVRELEFLRKRRKEFDLLLVRGGILALNRKACQTPEVDILTHPEFGRTDSGLDHVAARYAAENHVAIELNFRQILSDDKAKVLAYMRKNVQLAGKYGAPLILCSGALSEWELRDPFCMISMAVQLGLELKDAKQAISKVPGALINLSKKRRSPQWIMPGVRVVK